MGSDTINRRTLLTGTALLGLGGLLTACGQQAASEAGASASSPATPSETASAIASEAASESATPSPVITRGYSGQSKAPDGEYRKADGYGPAQNVPKPRNEPAKYPETEEGLMKMMQDWLVAHNYGTQTGDCSYAFKYVTQETDEYESYNYTESLYERGGWIIGGLESYQAEGPLIYDDQKKNYRMKFSIIWSTVTYVNPDGRLKMDANTDTADDSFYFLYTYSDGYWKISGSDFEV